MQANTDGQNTIYSERGNRKIDHLPPTWTAVLVFFHKCLSACRFSAVKPDTLTDMTNQMTEKVGLVHGLPYVADRQGFAATLEQVRTDESELAGGRQALTKPFKIVFTLPWKTVPMERPC